MKAPDWTDGTARELAKVLTTGVVVRNEKDESIVKSALINTLMWDYHRSDSNWRWKIDYLEDRTVVIVFGIAP